VTVWCGLLGNKMIGPFAFDISLTGNTYEVFMSNELPDLLEDIPLMIRSQMYFQHDGGSPKLHSARERVPKRIFP